MFNITYKNYSSINNNMISIDKLISSISNLNEKELKFVPDNIFTQKTTYQILKEELLQQKEDLEQIND